MLIIRKDSVTDFLLGSGHNANRFGGLLERLQERMNTAENKYFARELIDQSCQKHLSRAYQDPTTKDSFLGKIASAAIFIGDRDLFRNAACSVVDGFDESFFITLGGTLCFEKPVIPQDE